MFICPHCEWPFASQNELDTHIEIRHGQNHDALLALVRQVQKNWEGVELVDDDLNDDGVYIDDDVIYEPYDDEEDDYDYTEGDIGRDGII